MSPFLRYMHDMLLTQSMMFDDAWLQHVPCLHTVC
jgi:hypothetical protein